MGEEAEIWQNIIINFFENRVAQSKLYKAREYIEKKDNEIKSEKEKKKLDRLVKAKEKKHEELKELRMEAPSTEIRQWIEKTSNQNISVNKRITKATHVLKFSNSSSLPESLLLDEKTSDTILTTSSLIKVPVYDLAHNNGALITVSRFLALNRSEKLIIDLIFDDDFIFLTPFFENKEQLDDWKKGFNKLVEKREIKTVDKAKQIYFPLINVDEKISVKNTEYHLIAPLFSSSMAEEFFSIVTNLKFGQEQKNVREQRNKGNENSSKYDSNLYISLSNLGVQKFGGNQPQNISMLNKNRNGKSYLFSNQPPTWQDQLKAPIYKNSLFDNFSISHINEDINYMREFLLRFERIDLSIKDPRRRTHLERWVNNIIDEVLFYSNSIQSLPSGWSNTKDIKLRVEYQYFLDPFRDEYDFQNKRKVIDWQKVVCSDFAKWLNRKLVGYEKKFTPLAEHTRIWITLFEKSLREDSETIKVELKYNKSEENV